MNPSREDLELYVSGNYDGDVAALERAIAEDPALAAIVADEARFEAQLRDAVEAATFCPGCGDLVRGERCDSCGAAVRPGGYVVEKVLVSNAHGRMYVAHDADGKQVALKELAFVQAPSPAAIEAFEREARFLRALEHPAIPRFVASFEEGSGVHTRYYLAQELVAGKALDHLDDHWYSEAEIVDTAKQVLEILVYLQSLSPMVIHRDIKPANLLKRPDGTIALVDFGAAHVHGTTAGLTTVGTFGYMPLEQLAGIVDATTDLYALGASLVYLLTRQEPWKLAQSKTTLNVSAPLRAFLDRLIANDPRERFSSAKEALAALERREAIVAVPAKPRRSWRTPLLAAAAAFVVMGGSFGVYKHATRGDDKPVVAPATRATLLVRLPDATRAELYVDGERIATVRDGQPVPVTAGERHIKLLGAGDTSCENRMRLEAGKITILECTFAMPAIAPGPTTRTETPRFTSDVELAWSFKQAPFHDVVQAFAEKCGVNVVVPSYVDAKITINIANHVACDAALEVLLESHGLWYRYQPDAKLLRIAPRKDLDREDAAAFERARFTAPPHEELPEGALVDLDLKNVWLRDALAMIAGADPRMNLVVPAHVDGRLTVRLKQVPWNRAFEAVLASQDLWYRYRSNGHLIRVAPRKDLDREDAAAFERSRHAP